MERRPWYAHARGRLIYGSIGAEWWSSITTPCIAVLVLFYPVPAGQRGYLLDSIGDPVHIDGFLYFLIAVCLAHLWTLCIPNTRRHIVVRKIAMFVEALCWSSVVFDMIRTHQLGSLPGMFVLAVLMWIGMARHHYPPL